MVREMSEWKALVARVTLFPAGFPVPAAQTAVDLYQAAWDVGPDSFNRSTNPLNPSVAHGELRALLMACSAHPSRIDFTISAPPSVENSNQSTVPLIENPAQMRQELEAIIGKIGNGLVVGSISRIALSLQFVIMASNNKDAAKSLSTILPKNYSITLKDEEDFILQLNTPRKSHRISSFSLNLMKKWSVDRFQILTFMNPAGNMIGITQSPPITEIYAASLLFDFNTPPMSYSISNIQQSTLLREFLSEIINDQKLIGLNIDGFSK